MSETELRKILGWVDSALDVYRVHEGKLTVSEISTRSMLIVVRQKLVEDLSQRGVRVQTPRPSS